MFKSMGIMLENSFYTSYNGFLFYLQKIPLLGKLIKDKFYNIQFFKNLAVFLGVVFKLIESIIKKIIYFNIIKFILSYIFGEFDLTLSKEYILSFMIILSVVGFVQTIDYFSGEKDDYIFVKLMRLRAKEYYRSKIYFDLIFNLISYTVVFGIIFSDMGFSFIDAFSYGALLFGLRIFSIMAFSKTFKFKGKKRNRLNLFLIIFFMAIAIIYLIYSVYNLSVGNYLFWQGRISYNRPIFLILSLICLSSSSILLYKTRIIENVAKIVLRKEIFSIDIEEVTTQSLKLDDKDLEETTTSREFENYKGIEYINRLFFHRFKKKFYKPIKVKSIIIAVLAIGINLLISRLEIKLDKESMEFFKYGFCLVGFLAGFLIYMGDRFTRLCFYNMDRFLMKNNFYRSPEFLSQAIKIRFKKMVTYNSPMLLILILGLIGILIQVGVPWYSYGLTILFSILGMVFFNFHYLYAYYLLQPFTENMETKNPVYSIFNIFAYYIIIVLMTLVQKFKWLALSGILAFIILYVVLGFILVMKFSHKRFKLR